MSQLYQKHLSLQDNSAVGFAAMSNASNGDDVLAGLDKEDAVVAATETEACLWRLELLHVAVAGGKVSVYAVEDVESGLAVDGAEIRTGIE
jgi:hypothetical protein